MKKRTSLETIQKIEKQIKEQFGKEALVDPNEFLDDEFQKKFEVQLKERAEKIIEENLESEMVEQNGFLISKRLITRERTNRVCAKCKIFSFNLRDDVYMLKYNCCMDCFILHIEGRKQDGKNQDVRE